MKRDHPYKGLSTDSINSSFYSWYLLMSTESQGRPEVLLLIEKWGLGISLVVQ